MGCVRAMWVILLFAQMAIAQQPPGFDFKDANTVAQWQGNRQIRQLDVTKEGLLITAEGNDPFITGPARDYPKDELLWLRMRIKSEQGGVAQVFYFKDGAREEASFKVPLEAGLWEEARLPLPALGAGFRLRIDPPAGKTILARIAFEPRDTLKPPQWPAPVALKRGDDWITINSGMLQLLHSRTELGGFVVGWDTKAGIFAPLAIGGNRGLIGYVHERKQRWIDLQKQAKVTVFEKNGWLDVEAVFRDEDGADWTISQHFSPDEKQRMIDVRTTVWVSENRQVFYLPLIFLHPGVGEFGSHKSAAIFPGLEYLDKEEPSSSEADIIGLGSNRRVPDPAKITIPLMSIGNTHWVALMWEPSDSIAAVFDSPDRLFKTDGHVMGLIFPGADPKHRSEGNLLPSDYQVMIARQPLSIRAVIAGGEGGALSAVEAYVAQHPLRPIPGAGLVLSDYVQLSAAGWLDSKIGENGLYRHAYPGNFNAHPAADAAAMMDWDAARSHDPRLIKLRQRLRDASKAAIAKLRPEDYLSANVGHIRTPTAALLYGGAEIAAAWAQEHGRELLKRFEPDGRVLYKKSGEIDYAKTHFAPDANGMTANLVAGVLEAGALSGDRKLIDEGLRLLRLMNKFDNSAPRGAQTWEIPLHTPDILASAHLVRAYSLGYQLSGDKELLKRASRWAWSGVPFVYLRPQVERPIGVYSTIAVLGATNWKAPNWMGQPVQWCGLVYADALYRLAPLDEHGPWRQLADGIVASGIQQSWPVGSDVERQGLLPDSFGLRRQQRVDVCINPATLQVPAAKFYGQPLYSFYMLKDLLIHVPGEIIKREEAKEALWMRVRGCTGGPLSILVCGCKRRPRVTINAAPPEEGAVKYVEDGGRLIVKLDGESSVLLEDL